MKWKEKKRPYIILCLNLNEAKKYKKNEFFFKMTPPPPPTPTPTPLFGRHRTLPAYIALYTYTYMVMQRLIGFFLQAYLLSKKKKLIMK
jgi:hypothetical protein